MTTNTGRSLLNAVLDAPDDDFHRLVYADWLEENGQEERAEFIRVQIELAKWTDSDGYMPMGLDREKLQGKERGLLLGVLSPFSWIQLAGERARRCVPDGAHFADHLTFRRGFIDEVHCSLDDWLTHMDAIMSQHPVRKVVTEKRPWVDTPDTDTVYWWRAGWDNPDFELPNWCLSQHVFDHMSQPTIRRDGGCCKRFTDEDSILATEQALNALSTTLVQMGYQAAKKLSD